MELLAPDKHAEALPCWYEQAMSTVATALPMMPAEMAVDMVPEAYLGVLPMIRVVEQNLVDSVMMHLKRIFVLELDAEHVGLLSIMIAVGVGQSSADSAMILVPANMLVLMVSEPAAAYVGVLPTMRAVEYSSSSARSVLARLGVLEKPEEDGKAM